MIVIFDRNGDKICTVEKDRIPLIVEDSADKKRRKDFLKTGAKTNSGILF